MKIVASELALQASHASLSYSASSDRLRFWTGERPDFEAQANGVTGSTIASISEAARQALAAAPQQQSAAPASPEADAIDAAKEAVDNDPFIILVRRMLELLTGKKVQVFDAQELGTKVRQVEGQAPATVEATNNRPNWGMEYDARSVHEEAEVTTFSASGTIRTADGKEISFSLDVAMERSYREETNLSLRAGNAVRKDPLVVNFDGTAAQLVAADGQRFSFDLNGDGSKETLPLFSSGSGYLALDRNGNTRIDNGTELFGPASGSGFAELAKLDSDGNGWIDAGDPAFARLSVWTPAAEGEGQLRSLADLGIGALALAHAATPFALRGDGNADLGALAASGLFVRENGTAGSLQEIDLTV